MTLNCHGRAKPSKGRRRFAHLCPGHPRLASEDKKDVDARDKRGHDAKVWGAG
jgi:hypothetical protein